MKADLWDHESILSFSIIARSRPARKTVVEILRAAYRKHVRDPHARRAVRQVLR